jgi:tetratricopeptide (TPR) repeat protein
MTKDNADKKLSLSEDALTSLASDVLGKILAVDYGGARQLLPSSMHAVPLNHENAYALQLRSLAFEIHDFFGEYSKASEWIRDVEGICAETLQDAVNAARSSDPAARRLMKQRIWIVSDGAHALYRSGDYRRSSARLKMCRTVLTQCFGDETSRSFPHGTASRLYYLTGLVHRQQREYALAKDNFVRSIKHLWSVIGEAGNPPLAAIEFQIGRCLALGLGWVAYAEGNAKLGEALIIAAQSLLNRSSDGIISRYVGVVHTSIERSANADTVVKISACVEKLEKARDAFNSAGHRPYAVRTEWELALAYLRAADLNKRRAEQLESVGEITQSHEHESAVKRLLSAATESANAMEDYARQTHLTWSCQARLIKSRALSISGQFRLAEEEADSALSVDPDGPYTPEALIARGYARLGLQDLNGAMSDFRDTQRLASGIPKVAAGAHLLMALAAVAMRDLHSAQLYFGEWQRGEKWVESAFLTRLADDVTERIRKLQGDFLIVFSEKNMEEPEVLHRKLNRWLVLWARERSSNNVEKARKLLGVSKQTFYNWERGQG